MSKDDNDRARRLAEALRQNLRRRKEQARGAPSEPAERDCESHGDGDKRADH